MSSESPVVQQFTQKEESTMDLTIDQNLSLYIPYIENQYANEEYIHNIFYSLNNSNLYNCNKLYLFVLHKI